MGVVGSCVTVAIPVFNAKVTLADALRSVFSQTYQDWQLLIIDDGSTDGTSEYLKTIRDERVTLVQDGQNLGLAARLNQAAWLCETPLLFRMDADDMMHPQRIEKQRRAAINHPSASMLGCRSLAIDDDGALLGLFREPTVGSTRRDWMEGCGLTHPTVVARTDWLRRHPYKESLRRAEDLDLWVRYRDAIEIQKLDLALHFYRVPRHVRVGSYRLQKACERSIIREHFSERDEIANRLQLLARSYAKETVAVSMSRLGLDSVLRARKIAPLPPAEAQEARSILRQIRSYRLPSPPDV